MVLGHLLLCDVIVLVNVCFCCTSVNMTGEPSDADGVARVCVLGVVSLLACHPGVFGLASLRCVSGAIQDVVDFKNSCDSLFTAIMFPSALPALLFSISTHCWRVPLNPLTWLDVSPVPVHSSPLL